MRCKRCGAEIYSGYGERGRKIDWVWGAIIVTYCRICDPSGMRYD